MATQVMTMDSNNNAENIASKMAEISVSSPDSNNNKGENAAVAGGDALVENVKIVGGGLDTVPEDGQLLNESHDKISEPGNAELQQIDSGITEQADINFEDTHPLERPWTMWFMNGDNKSKKQGIDNGSEWNQGLIELYTFDTVEDFWAVYNHIQLPAKLRLKNDYMVFKNGVRPEWEDTTNRGGGMWKLILPSKMRSTDLDRMWLETLLSMIGESYGSLGDLICGAYLQRRQKEDRIQLWTTKGTEEEIREIGAVLKEKLNLSKESLIHYLRHDDQTAGQNAGKNMSWSRKHKSDSLYHI